MTKSLIQRLEEASEGSRELDEEVHDLLCDRKTRTWIAGLPDEVGGLWMYEFEGHNPHSALRVTDSVDAALALTERVLPGWGYYLRHDKDGAACGLTFPEHTLVTNGHVEHRHSLPLALCIAVLKAKESHNV